MDRKTSIRCNKLTTKATICTFKAIAAGGESRAAKRSNQKAVRFYTLAAELGHAPSQYYLGRIYENGTNDVPQDFSKAIEWYEKSAKQGHEEAKKALKRAKKALSIIQNGANDAPQAFAEAIELYEKSAK
jgi:TPR repeat protein